MEQKNESIASLEESNAKLVAKTTKYKDQLESLQQAIREHQQVQQELQEKLKTESKSNAGKGLEVDSQL